MIAGGSGALAESTGPLDPITDRACAAPDLSSTLALLQPIVNTVDDVLACEEDVAEDPAPPAPAPAPALRSQASTPVVKAPAPAEQRESGSQRGQVSGVQRDGVSDTAVRQTPPTDILPAPIGTKGDGVRVPAAFFAGLLAGAAGVLLLRRRGSAQADAVERMKSELLSNISHELRTPLTPVRGYAEILRSRKLPPERVREFAEAILDASEQLESVVNILVSFAAIEAGRAEVHHAPVDLVTVLGEVTARWQRRAPGHVVSAAVPQRLSFPLLDGRLVKLAVEQLVDNAVKFSPEGGLVTVSAAVRAGVLEISVADQGIGIKPGQLSTIFESFRQGDGSSTRRFGGLGLGLSLVSRIARVHEGEVRVNTKPGAGSTITIAVPYKTVREIRLASAHKTRPVAVGR